MVYHLCFRCHGTGPGRCQYLSAGSDGRSDHFLYSDRQSRFQDRPQKDHHGRYHPSFSDVFLRLYRDKRLQEHQLPHVCQLCPGRSGLGGDQCQLFADGRRDVQGFRYRQVHRLLLHGFDGGADRDADPGRYIDAPDLLQDPVHLFRFLCLIILCIMDFP